MDLAKRSCRRGAPALDATRIVELRRELDPRWSVVDGRRLAAEYRFPDFARALAFVDRVGALADAQDHHPELHLSWGRVRIEIWTHDAGGLTENDFVLAAKVDAP